MNRAQKLNYLLLGLLVGIIGMWALTATTPDAKAAMTCSQKKNATVDAMGKVQPGWEPFAVGPDGAIYYKNCSNN